MGGVLKSSMRLVGVMEDSADGYLGEIIETGGFVCHILFNFTNKVIMRICMVGVYFFFYVFRNKM